MRTTIAILAVLVGLPAVSWAQGAERESPEATLKRAIGAFRFSDYATASKLADDLINNNRLSTTADQVEALRIAGLCSYYDGSEPEAERLFLHLLKLDPDYELDPFYTPPQAVNLFERVRSQNTEALAAIRKRAQEAEANRKKEEETRQKEKQTTKVDVEHHDRLLAFLPLGIGQFQNGDNGLGVALGTIQVATALTSVGCWVAHAVMDGQNPGGYLRGSPQQRTADALTVTAVATGAAFYATWLYSTVQALSGYQPTKEITGGVGSSGEKSKGNNVSSIAPFVVPTSGGGIAGLGLGF